MAVAIEELRRSMRQEFVLNRTPLVTRTYLEAFEGSAFDPADLGTLFHENSKYVAGRMGTPRRSVAEFETAAMAYTQAMIGPDYPGHALIDLPEPAALDEASLGAVLRNRRSVGRFGEGSLANHTLATMLGAACGVTGSLAIGHETLDSTLAKPLRAYPSAGGLYPVECYLLVLSGAELPTGCYYYVPDRHALRVLRSDDQLPAAVDRAIVGLGDAGRPSVLVVLTAALWRAMAKYGPRGYRYILKESGHLAQNLLLVAAALDLVSLPVGGFYDDAVNDLLDIDGVNEAAVYAIAVGQPADDESRGVADGR